AGQQATGCNGGQACDGMNVCKKVNGQGCGANSDCASNHCQDGYCCNSSCGSDCQACNVAGSLGTCTNVPAGQQAGACGGTQACDGMNGCNTACTGLCQACSALKNGGANGTCGNIPNNTDPDNECSGGSSKCNGMGA